MQWILGMRNVAFGSLAVAVLALTGCKDGGTAQQEPAGATEVAHDEHDHDESGHAEHGHGGWWCSEHGVPEEVCAQCDSSLITTFKEKGDWCEKHNRPESHCFICGPERFEAFAARYKAKMGEEPPTPDALAAADGS